MKITAFNPIILSNNAAELIKTFEAIGFEVSHEKTGISEADVKVARMKNENGYHVDVAQIDQIDRDITGIRVNVDDLEEAEKLLATRGFKEVRGTRQNTGTSLTVTMMAPTGLGIDLCEHVK